MKLSIVVPVYNTAEYLQQCIESILAQTYKEMEIILLDDGSTDGSGEICDEYAKRDKRITVVHKMNEGLTATRKRGVEIAKSEYICFVDSDDWIKETLVEKLVKKMKESKPDIIAYGYWSYKNTVEKERVNLVPNGTYSGEKLEAIYSTMMYDFEKHQCGVIQSIWSKVFKKDLLLNIYRDMDLRLTYGEDAAVVYLAFLQADLVQIYNEPLYYYRRHSNSMCVKKDAGKFQEVVYFYEYLSRVYEAYPSSFRLVPQLRNYIMFFMEMLVKNNFDIEWHIPYKIPMKSTKMVLYGAGYIGKRYYEEIIERKDICLVGWTDKNLGGQEINGQKICFPKEVIQLEFDCIVIAVLEKNIADNIRSELRILGIEDDKIIWQYPETNSTLRKVIF